MKVALVAIYDRGDLAKERVHFRATADLDLRYYVLLDTVYLTAETIQATQKQCYWFPAEPIKKDENIIVYSRAGASINETKSGTVYHFRFRGRSAAAYSDPSACAVLMEIESWLTIQ